MDEKEMNELDMFNITRLNNGKCKAKEADLKFTLIRLYLAITCQSNTVLHKQVKPKIKPDIMGYPEIYNPETMNLHFSKMPCKLYNGL